jgi:CubicO group peptidase (beta-lactamase class C family)
MKAKQLLFIILVMAMKIGVAQQNIPIHPTHSTEQNVNAFLIKEMDRLKIPGLQIVVISQNKIIFSKAYGEANVDFSIPSIENTMFSINSIAKIFTATCIMQLVEDGKLDIETPISNYIDSVPISWRKVTTKQLLSHTSGLPDVENDTTGGLVGNKGETTAWVQVKKLPLQFKAGSQFSYNATNYLLLGKIIEKFYHLPFEESIQKNQFDVVGMPHTIYGNSFNVAKNKAPTYCYYYQDKDSGEYIEGNELLQVFEEFPKMLRADAGIFSTASDIANWIIALQSKRLLKSDKSISTMWAPVKLNNGTFGGFGGVLNGYALGWPVVNRKNHPAIAAIGGGRSSLLIYPEDNLSIVVLTNLSGSAPELIIDKVAEFFYDN